VQQAGESDEFKQAEAAEWMPLLYGELRRIAHQARWRWSSHDTIGTTALVNEAYLRLVESLQLRDKGKFLGLAAVAIRRILVDRVRHQLALKRGGDAQQVELDEADGFVVEDDETVLAVHEALEGLSDLNPRLAHVVECQFFAGYSQSETAQALGISVATVERDWATARAWLRRELQS
jgi:RNA polymerase sigma factor (TIGR02999 family)